MKKKGSSAHFHTFPFHFKFFCSLLQFPFFSLSISLFSLPLFSLSSSFPLSLPFFPLPSLLPHFPLQKFPLNFPRVGDSPTLPTPSYAIEQHRIEIFVLLCFFFKTRTTHNWYKMAEHYSQDSYLYFIRSFGQQRALYIKMASFKPVLFFKKRKQHRIEIFVLLCFFSKHAQRTTDIRWWKIIHKTLIFIYKILWPTEGTLYQNGFF